MALTNWGFIYTADGMPAGGEFTVTDTGSCRTALVGVSSPGEGIEVASELIADGAQLIELCGGFGPVWTGRIVDATGAAVPVGSVGYGPEAVSGLHAIFG